MKPIAVFAPYPELAEIFESLRHDCPVDFDIYNTLCDEAVPMAQKVLDLGCRVLISRGETAVMMKNALNLHESYILEIPITDCDRLSMLTAALEYGNKIAIVGFGVTMNMSKFIRDIVSKDVILKFYRLTSVSDIKNICKKITEDGFKIIAGTPRAIASAPKYGAVGIPLLTERSSIESVLADAVKLVRIFEKRHSQAVPEEIHKINSIVFDFNGRITSDTTGLDSKTKMKIAGDARLVKSDKNIYGNAFTQDGRKLHYIITYIGNTAKNVSSCCHVCEEYGPSPAPAAGKNRFSFDGFLTKDEALLRGIAYMKGIASTDSTLIIYGETGTGKSMLAAAMHAASPRRDRPFISFNCATIPETLIESELFGYYGGAFTGASRKGKKGYFELAHGGTIFLDEVNELSQSAQTKILKFFEDRTFIPVGSEESVSVDVRVICATNKPLHQMVRQSAFRSDLYYRLSVFEVMIPSLRERAGDIPLLAARFADEFNTAYRHNFRLTPKLLRRLQRFDYPGNVRQLRNIMERLVVTSKLRMPLEDSLTGLMPQPAVGARHTGGPLLDLHQVEQNHIRLVLEATDNNRNRASEILGISKSTLWRKCRELRILLQN